MHHRSHEVILGAHLAVLFLHVPRVSLPRFVALVTERADELAVYVLGLDVALAVGLVPEVDVARAAEPLLSLSEQPLLHQTQNLLVDLI